MFKIYGDKISQQIKSDLIKAFGQVEIKQEGKKVYKMLISKEVQDRDGEIISLDGLIDKWYKANPIVLIDHSYKIDDIVGKTIKLYREGNKLYADFIFANTEKAQTIEKMYVEGFINASSIGFMVGKRTGSLIEKSELLEWSLVVAGSNRDALREKNIELYNLAKKSGLLNEVKTTDNLVNETEEEIVEVAIEEENKTEMQEVKKELAEIKTMLKILTDDKVEEQKTEDITGKKATLQIIDNAIGVALQNIKLLK